MSSISTWEELRKAARKLEGELDLKLESYSKFGASFEKTKSSLLPEDVQNTDHVFGSMAIEIEQLLMKVCHSLVSLVLTCMEASRNQ